MEEEDVVPIGHDGPVNDVVPVGTDLKPAAELEDPIDVVRWLITLEPRNDERILREYARTHR